MQNKTKNKEFFTTRELADLLNLSRITIFNWIKKGKIKAQKVGKSYIIPRSELRDFLSEELSAKKKAEIDKGVRRAITEYGETLKKLGKE